jgi:hypothetical protein
MVVRARGRDVSEEKLKQFFIANAPLTPTHAASSSLPNCRSTAPARSIARRSEAASPSGSAYSAENRDVLPRLCFFDQRVSAAGATVSFLLCPLIDASRWFVLPVDRRLSALKRRSPGRRRAAHDADSGRSRAMLSPSTRNGDWSETSGALIRATLNATGDRPRTIATPTATAAMPTNQPIRCPGNDLFNQHRDRQ